MTAVLDQAWLTAARGAEWRAALAGRRATVVGLARSGVAACRLLRACGKGLELVERPGAGVDRTLIRDRLRLSPGERARLAAREWERTRMFGRRGRSRA